MISTIVSFFSSINTKVWIAIAVVIGCIVGYNHIYDKGYEAGVSYVNSKVHAETVHWQETIANLQTEHQAEIAKLNAEHSGKIEKLNQQLEQLNQDPSIITKYFDVNTPVSEGFVVWHNRCAAGEPLNTFLPAPTSNAYTIGDVANKVAINYNSCNKCIDRLTKLQTIVRDFIEKQDQAVTNK